MSICSRYSGYFYRVTQLLVPFFILCSVVQAETAVKSAATSTLTTPLPKIKYSKLKPAQKALTGLSKNSVTGITDNELASLSKNFAAALLANKPADFALLLDEEAIIQKAIIGAIQNLGDLTAVREKIRRGIKIIPNLFVSKMGARGNIQYLRIIERDMGHRGLLRLKFNSGELSYLEIIARKNQHGEIRIVDFYDAMLGRLYTTVVSQLLITPIKKQNDSDTILYFQNKPLTFQQRYAKTIRFYIKGNFKQAIDSFQHLPLKFKTGRNMLLLRTQIAKATNKNAYREALMLLNNKFQNAPELALLISDHYYFSKQYPRALHFISEFSDYIGGDIALDNLKVKLHIQQKHYKKALMIGNAALKYDDSYQDLYWLMLKGYLNTYQYEHVGEILDVLLDKFNADIALDTFYKEPFYREYGFSKQFKKWKAARDSTSQ